MDVVLNIFFLITGFALLIKGADVFVDAAVDIAKKLHVPGIIIGLTIVAFGTSAPEAVVSISAAARGSNALAIGNVVGSNMFNILMAVGMCAVIRPVLVNFKEFSKDYWISVGATVLLLVMLFIFGNERFGNEIPRLAGAGLLLLFIIYMYFTIHTAMKNRPPQQADSQTLSITAAENAQTDTLAAAPEEDSARKPKPIWLSILLVIVGIAGVVAGGQLTVTGAVAIAAMLGMTERVIGLTIIAVGTSLPELVTSIVASVKKQAGIAIGNVVGSNIFNILLVPGLSGYIMPLAIDRGLIFDFAALLIINIVFLFFTRTGSRITRSEGLVLIAMYTGYMTYTLVA